MNIERCFLKFLVFDYLVSGVFVCVVEQKMVCCDMFLGIFIGSERDTMIEYV